MSVGSGLSHVFTRDTERVSIAESGLGAEKGMRTTLSPSEGPMASIAWSSHSSNDDVVMM